MGSKKPAQHAQVPLEELAREATELTAEEAAEVQGGNAAFFQKVRDRSLAGQNDVTPGGSFAPFHKVDSSLTDYNAKR